MWLNHGKYRGFRKVQFLSQRRPKVSRDAPKRQFFETFCGTLWAPWRVFGPTVGSKLPSRPRTVTVQAHREHS